MEREMAVVARELTRRFGRFVAVDRVSFSVARGEIFGFLGPNGAGKTTTIKMLVGLLEPSAGQATVVGLDLATQAEALKRHVGYMSQLFSLYGDLTVEENIAFFAGLYEVQGARYGERRDWVGRDHGDLLSVLLTAQDEGAEGVRMTEAQVQDEALTLFLTSFVTVSLALTWTLYALSHHPGIEERLVAEIDSVLGGRPPTVDDLPDLPVARMVLSEGLRLYPPIFAIARDAAKPVAIGGYTIPAGTLVLTSPYLLQRDGRFFARPAEFDPWRWSPERGERPPTFAYFPFGGGPRRCLGQGYAWQEGTLMLATLLQRWRFQRVAGHRAVIQPLINLRPLGGMRMVVRRRV